MILIDLPSYPVRVLVSITDDVCKARSSAESELILGPLEALKVPSHMVGGLCGFREGRGIMFFTPGVGPGVVAHECLHMVCRIFDTMGIKLCAESEEAWSYLLEYLVEEVTKLLKLSQQETKTRSTICQKSQVSSKRPRRV